MREVYDPVYYPPVIQGFDEYSHYSQYQRPRQPPQYQPPPPVSKSPSSGSVFGKLLKLGKSKSDVGISASSSGLSVASPVGSVRGSRSGATSCEVDDFRLSPSVISRGPVQKMVHNSKVNKRDVSRSHSWIYGSVKLASDLPFGYGEQFSADPPSPGSGGGPSHPQGHYLHTHSLHAMQIPRCQLDYSCTCPGGDSPPEWGSVRQPRGKARQGDCQGCAQEMAMKYALPSKQRGSLGGQSGESFVSSVKKLTWKSLKQVVKKRPSLDTLRKGPQGPGPIPTEYMSAPIVPMPYLSPSAVAAATAAPSQHGGDTHSQNVNPMANPQSHYGHGHVAPSGPHPGGPDYFFPEKKQFYASCQDIYGEPRQGPPSPPNHVTASVRVRPKRTRQPWQLTQDAPTSEFGPVANCEDPDGPNPPGLYHSEWDLRNVMSYDMWMSATSNVKPRSGQVPSSGSSTVSSKRSHSAEARHWSSQGNLSVPAPDYGVPVAAEPPTTFRPKSTVQSAKSSSSVGGKGSVSSSKSLTSLHSPLPKTSSGSNSLSSSHSSDTLKISSYTTGVAKGSPGAGIVKRGSILAADVTAYQLLKQQKKKEAQSSMTAVKSAALAPRQPSILKNRQPEPIKPAVAPVEIEDAFSESSDDLSDNAINGPSTTENSGRVMNGANSATSSSSGSGLGVRIAGQGIRMLPNSGSKNDGVTTVVVPPKQSPRNSSLQGSRSQSRSSITSNTSVVKMTTTSNSSESESDRWSDCHSESRRTRSSHLVHTTSTNGGNLKSSINVNGQPHKTASVKVNGSSGAKRQSMVTFEKGPPPPPQLPPNASATSKPPQNGTTLRIESDMEFEEYEVDHRNRLQHDSLKSKDNVVSLSVTAGASPSTKPQYIKHNKTSPNSSSASSSSSSTSSSKFGALRRRKRGGSAGPSNPGKLLQETIYEESDPERADSPQNRGQNPHQAPSTPKHSLKIAVGPTTPPQNSLPSPAPPKQQQSTVKPILKNHNRTYETPVVTTSSENSNNDSCNNDSLSRWYQQDTQDPDSSQQIYFDSSVSTTSTKKKVQFDQSKVVVHGASSSSSGSEGAGSGAEDAYDYENDDSDQWSNKSEEEDETPSQQQQQNAIPQQQQMTLPQSKAVPTPVQNQEPRPKSLFEEEVARKAAALAKSRQLREEEEVRKKQLIQQQQQIQQQKLEQQSSPIVRADPKMVTLNGEPRNNASRPAPQAPAAKNSNGPTLSPLSKQQSAGNGPPQSTQIVINPNSLLFHDTTRIRLNQSRPALQDNTFKLPNGQVSGKSGTRGITRLKQSNSFRSVVGSIALRPREPPPPPPSASSIGSVRASLGGVPARLQKALSTSTLLSKSTEKLNVGASSKTGSHYGPGGRLLPSKSQISLPMGLSTTYKAAGLLAASSTSTQDIPSVSFGASGVAKRIRDSGHLSKSSSSLASRSKSLTDRCEALEKVLKEQRVHEENVQETPKLRSAPSMPSLHLQPPPLNSAADMDSKSIEIVTKENDVSEIRIYSASTGMTPAPSYDENLPYQGIIYESTKTIITTESSEPPTVSSTPKVAPPRPPPPEIHYAATDLFPSTPSPAPSATSKVSTPKSSPLAPSVTPTPPFSHPPLPAIPVTESEYECSGKSVVLIIDNNKKAQPTKALSSTDDSTPLTNYSQPIDTIPRGSILPPTIPLPSIPCDAEEVEPLYDDVISHSVPDVPAKGSLRGLPPSLGELPPLPPPPVPPHRSPVPSSPSTPLASKEVVSSTLPCLACPPSLPPPNLPSKSLSEFHNRPLVIQENEEDRLELEVDNLYNDITTPSNTLKSSTASQFATAMKSALFGAIGGNKRNSGDFSDQRSIHSVGSNSSKKLIYEDTLSVNSSSGASSSTSSYACKTSSKSAKISHQQQLVPLPLPPPPQPPSSNKPATPAPALEQCMEDIVEEPLYDDVLNLTATTVTQQTESNISSKKDGSNGGGSEYHSSTNSDSGTEDLPPPLPAQGPPPLPKGELPLLTFPIISTTPPVSSKNTSKEEPLKGSLRGSTTLLSELNEKLSKLNVTSSQINTVASRSSPGAGSSSSGGDASSGEFNSEENFHISKVVISPPSSESSGVEEDYRSLGGSGSSTSSRGGSDNEGNSYRGKKTNNSINNGGNNVPPLQQQQQQQQKMPSQAISMARGKFLENMKLSMLGAAAPAPAAGPKGLLIVTSGSVPAAEEDEEPIYEEIGEHVQQMRMEVTSRIVSSSIPPPVAPQSEAKVEEVEEDEEDNRSNSPLYADAFDAKSMFDGASRSEIISFLESVRDRLTGAESASSSSESQSSSISRSSSSATKSLAEDKSEKAEEGGEGAPLVEDKKSGNEQTEQEMHALKAEDLAGILEEHEGKEELLILEEKERLHCYDCNDDIEEGEEHELNNNLKMMEGDDPTVTTGLAHPGEKFEGGEAASKLKCCRSCNRKRNEKKEIIMEIYETELKYGRDLKIVSEEFYKPIQVAGLLTKDQLDQIFLNVDELMQINQELTGRLKQEIQRSQQHRKMVAGNGSDSNKKEDELSEVNVGKIFMELGENMMTAFENYCTRQASAGALLSQLEKEKELLRIFLRVSQMENTVLRRMNLPAFLMVPVQRVTRYPLLLARLLKVTPVDHFSREEIFSAQEKIEQHLEHMNKTTREVASVKLWRRISIINGSSNNGQAAQHRRSNSDLDASNIRIRKMAMDVLDWTGFSDVTCVLDNQLGNVHFNGKPMRNIYGCLLVRGKDLELLASKIQDQDPFFPPAAEDAVKDVKLVLVRVKNTRFCLLREPLCLSKCVVSQGENEFQEFIEINEITTKNTYFIQGLDRQGTATWLRFLQCYSSCVGHWRRRRHGLANIMMNGMIKHL